jgi:hypothetical protein
MRTYDSRYAFVTCKHCGKVWQRLDFGCALHNLSCDKAQRFETIEPTAPSGLTADQRRAFDLAGGAASVLAVYQ